jgi:hypothetical protein
MIKRQITQFHYLVYNDSNYLAREQGGSALMLVKDEFDEKQKAVQF